MRKNLQFRLDNPEIIAEQLHLFFQGEEWLSVYTTNQNTGPDSEFDLVAGVGALAVFSVPGIPALDGLQGFFDKKNDWLFGYLSYDVKNEIENLNTKTPSPSGFPAAIFYQPVYVFRMKGNLLDVSWPGGSLSEAEVSNMMVSLLALPVLGFREEGIEIPVQVKSRISRTQYLQSVEKIKAKIQAGEMYEMNFCSEFYAENIQADPARIFFRLNRLSQAPFAASCRYGEFFLISSSPERFLKRSGNRLLSQPMKGTFPRGAGLEKDREFLSQLLSSPKERNENVMIVDIVRNDLSRLADRGTVQVSELFGVRSYRQVHQMVSTIESRVKNEISFADIIRASFPMGSMTGAPKIRAMQWIDHFENSGRGVYSGALGYMDPGGDFDFSVIIRTILYNRKKRYLSFSTGSAITDNCVPEKEYEECMLKASALLQSVPAKLIAEL